MTDERDVSRDELFGCERDEELSGFSPVLLEQSTSSSSSQCSFHESLSFLPILCFRLYVIFLNELSLNQDGYPLY